MGLCSFSPQTRRPGSPPHDWKVRTLAEGAGVPVYDAQFTAEELQEKKGWGHSSCLEGTRITRESQIRRLLLCHHDPDHDDALVDGLVAKARREFSDVDARSLGGDED